MHRKPFSLFSVFLVVACVVVLIIRRPLDSVISVMALVTSVVVVPTAAWAVVRRLRPFRFHIGPDGLTLRTRGINRLVGWSEIYALVLTGDSPHRLVLVPSSSGFEAKLDRASPVDAKPGLDILDLGRIKETPAEVAKALSRYGGERFVDATALESFG